MARNPNNIIPIQYSASTKEIRRFTSIPEYDIEDYDLNNPKEFTKYIASIEKICRNSLEYKSFINFLREDVGMNTCSFMQNVNNIESLNIKIHIHHEPITMFDIVMAVYNKRNSLRESISENMVAKEVMYNHYRLHVGLIPLCETVHELVHNQYLFVPSNAVFGKYKEFVKEYEPFIEQETLLTLEKIEEMSKTYTFDQAQAVLKMVMIYIDASGTYKIPDKLDIIASLKNIANAKSNDT